MRQQLSTTASATPGGVRRRRPTCSSQSSFSTTTDQQSPVIGLPWKSRRHRGWFPLPPRLPDGEREKTPVAVPVLFQTKKGGIHCHCLLSAVFRRYVFQPVPRCFVPYPCSRRIFPVNLAGDQLLTVVPFRFVPPRISFCFGPPLLLLLFVRIDSQVPAGVTECRHRFTAQVTFPAGFPARFLAICGSGWISMDFAGLLLR